MNYIKLFEDGTSEAVDVKPSWGMYEKEHALDNREVYIDGNWYSTTGGELLVGTDFSDGLLGNWTSVNNGVPTIVNNQLKIVDASPYSSGVEQTITCNIGDKIVVKYYTSGIRAAALWLDSLILYSSDTGTYIGEVSEEFIATSTSHIISLQTGSSIDRDDLYIDNISVYKVEPTIDTLQPPHTYLSNKGKLAGIEVVGGIPVDLHYDELAPDINIDCIVTNELSSFNGNRKIIELGTIFNNNRYVVDNPFGNEKYEDCDVRAEIFFNSMWSESNVWVDGTLARGVKGFSNQEGIAVQTGSQAVLQEQSSQSLNGFGSTGNTTPTSAPARVIVTYIGEAK